MDYDKKQKDTGGNTQADKVDGLKENLEFNKNYQVPKDEIDEDEIGKGYQLSFIGKNYAKLLVGQKTETVIVPDVKHNSKGENAQSENVFIAGDNLDCLKHLENAYTNKVDVIYIDPPYNTGGDGFVYADNFKFSDEQLQEKLGLTENEVARVRALTGKSSHSAWLTFMYPRLVIAKRLLKDTGVIFVSIDDNEQANLKLLMDEMFGEGNFYGQITQKKGSTQNDSKTIQRNCDYHLVYSKRGIEGLTTYDSANERQLYENKYFLGRDTGSSSGHDKLTDRNNLGYTVYYWEGNQNGATGNNNKLTDRNIK